MTKDILPGLVRHPKVICAVQFGSSISGDTWEGSDIDVLVVARGRKKALENLFRNKLGYKYQIHVYSKREFVASVHRREPLSLSVVHTGKVLRNKTFVQRLKKYTPTEYTVKRCMLNSFAALGLCVSDIELAPYDSINGAYHAARSAIWATLMMQEITPNNRRTLRLTSNPRTRRLFSRLIAARHNLPKCTVDSKTLWMQGNYNRLTNLLEKAQTIIKQSYAATCGESFIDFFELLSMWRKKYRNPAYYSIYLFVDWKKLIPTYHATLSYPRTHIFKVIDARSGDVITEFHKPTKPS